MEKIKITDHLAYIARPFMLIVLNDEELGYYLTKNGIKLGHRCTQKAYETLVEKKGICLIQIISVEIDEKIIWVTMQEFEDNNFIEREIKQKEFLTQEISLQ